MSLCLCGCDQEVSIGKKFIRGHSQRINHPRGFSGKHHKFGTCKRLPFYPIPSLCLCGCNEVVWNGNKLINGHQLRYNIKLNPNHQKEAFKKLLDKNPNHQKIISSNQKRDKLWREKISRTLIGHPLYRPRRSDFWYNSLNNGNLCFRSSWELEFAKYLDSIEEEWKYESKQFHLGDSTYTPDFYLKNFDLYIEIKGFWQRGYKEKFEKFKLLYSNTDIVVIEHSPPYELPNLFKHTDIEMDVI